MREVRPNPNPHKDTPPSYQNCYAYDRARRSGERGKQEKEEKRESDARCRGGGEGCCAPRLWMGSFE